MVREFNSDMDNLLDYCLEIGIDVHSVNVAGDSALILACKKGNLERVVKVSMD
jgi:ankyrin repeat protein